VPAWFSWNGGTGVAAWRPVAGPAPDRLSPVGRRFARNGFETRMTVTTGAHYVAVRALDAAGHVLATSRARSTR
jgi:hypothetical protein